MPATTITRIEAPLNLVTTTLTTTGAVAPQQGGYANLVVPGIFSFLLALSLFSPPPMFCRASARRKRTA